ncbi:MAG: response regulator [Anaerolineae bacterium]|nr:response regulator [Anaerolineae bacterium]
MEYRVVSVEDDQEIAELLGVVLQSPQIDLHSADNGTDGLTLIRQIKPDLIMLDVMMPGMSGWDVYDVLRSDETLKTIPIIILSVTREGVERRRQFAGSDIDVYMTKPFDTLKLRREIERLLGHKGLWPPPTGPLPQSEIANMADPAAKTNQPDRTGSVNEKDAAAKMAPASSARTPDQAARPASAADTGTSTGKTGEAASSDSSELSGSTPQASE